MCGVFAAKQPSAYIPGWCVGQQRCLESEQPDAFMLAIELTWSLIKAAIHTLAASPACPFHQNYHRTMIYHWSMVIRGTKTVYIVVCAIHPVHTCRSHALLCRVLSLMPYQARTLQAPCASLAELYSLAEPYNFHFSDFISQASRCHFV